MTSTKRTGHPLALTAATGCAALALCGVGWLLAGPSGLLAAGIAGALVALLVVRLLHVPSAPRPAPPACADVPFEDAPYVRYRKLFSALSWGQVSARQFDHATRRHIERVTGAVLSERRTVDPVTNPDAARELLGDDLWALADPDRPRSDDSNAPATPLQDAGRCPSRSPSGGAVTAVAETELDLPQCATLAARVLDEVERAIVGKRATLRMVLLGILASGHVLLEDLPGLGKTLLARSFATALGLRFTRVQFTPDLLPADLTGAPVYDPRSGELSFRPGPVFTQLLLADEINRTPPKTQAALLEAMSEHQVSTDGETMQLPEPFVVLATDNPIEFEGTYPLPEAQLDRFVARVRLGYPGAEDEAELLRRRIARATPELPTVRQVVDTPGLLAMRRMVERVEADDDLLAYVVAVTAATRQHAQCAVGASPRASLALLQLARAHAMLDSRDFLIPDDVKAVAVPALGHRVVLRPELWVRRLSGDDVVADVLRQVPVPHPAPSRRRDAAP